MTTTGRWGFDMATSEFMKQFNGICSVPMWTGGVPDGFCGKPAYGVYIDGPKFRDAYTGRMQRLDGKFDGYVPHLACPSHSGPSETGPRVFADGLSETGRRMWCAVYEDFENLQENPAEFHENPWTAIARLEKKHPRLPVQL